MTKDVFRKGLVIGIIVLFVGAGVTTSISGNINKDLKADVTSCAMLPQDMMLKAPLIEEFEMNYFENSEKELEYHQETAISSIDYLSDDKSIFLEEEKEYRYDLKDTEFAPGEFIVKFKRDKIISISETLDGWIRTGLPSIDVLNEKYEVVYVEKLFKNNENRNDRNGYLHNIFKFCVSSEFDILSIIQEYSNDPNVVYADPNYIVKPCLYPNDPSFNEQWALHNTGQYWWWTPDADVDAPEAWDIETGDESIVIAIIDGGVDWDHPDLAENIWNNADEIPNNGIDDDGNGYIDDIRGWDFANDDNDPMDEDGHGTQCAGVASAVTNNGLGVAGLCWNCSIMPIKFINWKGKGTLSNAAESVVYGADNGANVISMSFITGPGGSLEDAIYYAYDLGVYLIASTGNENNPWPYWPASYDCVTSVAATDYTDTKASFSSYGWQVDVASPGVACYTVQWDDGYGFFSGTSCAAPYVAGLAGLILSKNPNLNPDEVRTIIKSTVDPVNSDKYIGTGRINAYKAIQRNSNPVVYINKDFDYYNYNFEQGLYINGTYNITGTAIGSTFQNYTLYYGEGVYPSNWTYISSSTSPVNDDILGSLDTTTVADGLHTIRLEVFDTFNQISIDYLIVEIENMEISFPEDEDIFRLGDTINITGTIAGATFVNYIIEYGIGENPTIWYSDGIYLIDNGQNPVVDGLLAYWNTSYISTANYYTIKLTATFTNFQNNEYVYTIYLDPTLKEGWPQFCGYLTQGYGISASMGPVISDVNNDGIDEIIVYFEGDFYSSSRGMKICVFEPNGTQLDGWPVIAGNGWTREGYMHYPLVGDIDDDGFDELIARNHEEKKLYAFNHDGSIVDGWPVNAPGGDYEFPQMILSDLNFDGLIEIIYWVHGYDWSYNVYILNNIGEIISYWTLSDVYNGVSGGIERTPALGNFDGDSDLEIVLSSGGNIYVCNMDGTDVAGWPVSNDYLIHSSPAVGDIDNDGDLEIIIGTFGEGIYVYDKTGSIFPGWPKNPGEYMSSPSLADFDGDNDLEIVISGSGGYGAPTYIYHYNGVVANGWPNPTSWTNFVSSTIGDIDGDNYSDITAASGSGFWPDIYNHGGVYGWNYNGGLFTGFPKVTASILLPATIGDIDDDGYNELLAVSRGGYLYVWETNGLYSKSNMQWPMYKHDQWLTGLYGFNIPPQAHFSWLRDDKTVTFNASLSDDPDGTVNVYEWDFGDDEYGNGILVEHTYSEFGLYNVILNVTDDEGKIDAITKIVFVDDPPYVPYDPYPENDSIDIDLFINLSWSGGDPNVGDSVVYDVYFEANDQTPDIKIADDITFTEFNPGILDDDTIYYWQINAKDNHGLITDGHIWHFTTIDIPDPNLDCSGTLSWTGVTPGETVTGLITVGNIGEPESLLDWEVESYPDWGTWSFVPDNGTGLLAGDSVNIDVEIVVPDDPNTEFTGDVTIINIENSSDYCTIPVYLKTPRNKAINNPFLNFLQSHPNLFPLLQRLLQRLVLQ